MKTKITKRFLIWPALLGLVFFILASETRAQEISSQPGFTPAPNIIIDDLSIGKGVSSEDDEISGNFSISAPEGGYNADIFYEISLAKIIDENISPDDSDNQLLIFSDFPENGPIQLGENQSRRFFYSFKKPDNRPSGTYLVKASAYSGDGAILAFQSQKIYLDAKGNFESIENLEISAAEKMAGAGVIGENLKKISAFIAEINPNQVSYEKGQEAKIEVTVSNPGTQSFSGKLELKAVDAQSGKILLEKTESINFSGAEYFVNFSATASEKIKEIAATAKLADESGKEISAKEYKVLSGSKNEIVPGKVNEAGKIVKQSPTTLAVELAIASFLSLLVYLFIRRNKRKAGIFFLLLFIVMLFAAIFLFFRAQKAQAQTGGYVKFCVETRLVGRYNVGVSYTEKLGASIYYAGVSVADTDYNNGCTVALGPYPSGRYPIQISVNETNFGNFTATFPVKSYDINVSGIGTQNNPQTFTLGCFGNNCTANPSGGGLGMKPDMGQFTANTTECSTSQRLTDTKIVYEGVEYATNNGTLGPMDIWPGKYHPIYAISTDPLYAPSQQFVDTGQSYVSFSSNPPKSKTFCLEKTVGSITGRVMLEGTTQGVANVQLVYNGTVVTQGETNASGYYTISSIPAGTYSIYFQMDPTDAFANNFLPSDARNVTIRAGATVTEDFYLKPRLGTFSYNWVPMDGQSFLAPSGTIPFSITVSNQANVPINGVTMDFYFNGAKVGSSGPKNIPARQNVQFAYNYVYSSVPANSSRDVSIKYNWSNFNNILLDERTVYFTATASTGTLQGSIYDCATGQRLYSSLSAGLRYENGAFPGINHQNNLFSIIFGDFGIQAPAGFYRGTYFTANEYFENSESHDVTIISPGTTTQNFCVTRRMGSLDARPARNGVSMGNVNFTLFWTDEISGENRAKRVTSSAAGIIYDSTMPAGVYKNFYARDERDSAISELQDFTIDAGETTRISIRFSQYACVGAFSNAYLCAGDNLGLTSNVISTLRAACSLPLGSAPKCEFVCNAGFTYSSITGQCESGSSIINGECDASAIGSYGNGESFPRGGDFCQEGTPNPASPSLPNIDGSSVTWQCMGTGAGAAHGGPCPATRQYASIPPCEKTDCSCLDKICGNEQCYDGCGGLCIKDGSPYGKLNCNWREVGP